MISLLLSVKKGKKVCLPKKAELKPQTNGPTELDSLLSRQPGKNKEKQKRKKEKRNNNKNA